MVCVPGIPDVANLPAGEVILFQLVLKDLSIWFGDGTLAKMNVSDGLGS